MQTLLSRKDFAELGAPDLVYVREVKASELLAESPVLESADLQINPEQILYAVHGADGARLAVLMEREEAFAAAVAHELAPVSVH